MAPIGREAVDRRLARSPEGYSGQSVSYCHYAYPLNRSALDNENPSKFFTNKQPRWIFFGQA